MTRLTEKIKVEDILEENDIEVEHLELVIKKARAMDIYWKKVEYDAVEFEDCRKKENGLAEYNKYAKNKLTQEEWDILVEVFALYD